MFDRPTRWRELPLLLRDRGRNRVLVRGTYLEVEPPIRTVETWLFNLWPDAEAVETMELHETDGVTTFTWKLAFRDKAGRDHMTGFDGQQDSLDEMEDILRSLLDLNGTVSE